MKYHEGELAVQARAGVQAMAQRIGRGIHAEMPLIAQMFLQEQRIAVAASIDSKGDVWASLLTGEPGFMSALDEQTVLIEMKLTSGDPLVSNLTHNPQLGLIVIDFATRQRIRLNGTAEIHPDGFYVTIQQAYSNCPKYIQPREIDAFIQHEAHEVTPQQNNVLTAEQQRWIGEADTFFIASANSDAGADASHRGGPGGFVHVIDAATLEFPDYAGNTMFNTLGNIVANPHSGLLFLDFVQGRTLQLTGRAEIIWEAERAAVLPGAQRVVEFHIEQAIEIPNAMPFHFV